MKTIPILLALLCLPVSQAATSITITYDDQCGLTGTFIIDPLDRRTTYGGPLIITFGGDPDVTDYGTDVYVEAEWHDPWGSHAFNFGDAVLPYFSGYFDGYGHEDWYSLTSEYVGAEIHGVFWFSTTECDDLPPVDDTPVDDPPVAAVPECGPSTLALGAVFGLLSVIRSRPGWRRWHS